MSTLDWRDDGACAGMTETHGAEEVSAIFFPERGANASRAKRICAECPVAEQCLEHALTQPERFGIWGGKSEKERRAMRRERGLRDPSGPRPSECGTRSAYQRCRERSEGPCDACRAANTAYQAERRAIEVAS